MGRPITREFTQGKTILKFLGYRITINNKYYTITW